MSLFVGIDPGKKGGVVVLARGGGSELQLIDCFRAEADYVLEGEYRAKAMREVLHKHSVDALVALERQQPMPKEGVRSVFSIGRGFGLWEGLVHGLGLPLYVVRPREWQVVLHGLPGEGKARAILAVEQRLPQLELLPGKLRKPHEGLADAACIAMWLARQGGSP